MASSRTARRRPRAWTALLALVLAGLSGYAVLLSRHQAELVESVAAAGTDSSAYQQAAFRAAREMVVIQAVLREPYGEDRAEMGAADQLAAVAMARMVQVDREHGIRAVEIQDEHTALRPVIDRYVRHLDSGDTALAQTTLEDEIEPAYTKIMTALLEEQTAHLGEYADLHAAAQADAGRSMVTGLIVFGLVLVVVALLAWSTRAHRRQVEAMAATDPLTGLPNRTAFTAFTEAALPAGPAVLVVNVDGFRDVNDQLGQSVGDRLLIEVGRRLSSSVRDGDVVARLGGDEFAILLPAAGAGPGLAAALAERLTEAFETPFDLDQVTVDLEVSIGAATGGLGDDAVVVLRQADAAMHAAKQERAGFRVYDAGHRQDVAARLTLLGDLRRAIDDTEQISLHYQPKIAIGTGDLVGVEALARWQHPVRGPIPPNDFIPVLEATGLMHRFTDRVLTLALRQAAVWRDAGHPIPVAVNVSTRSLLEASFPDRVAQLLGESGLPGSQLCIEVTEHTVMSDPATAIDALSRVRALGVKTSIDDYGTGYSSMTYLKLLPVDELKIDRSFVRDMAGDRSSLALVSSTVELGHSLGLTVVAEGVEDADTVAALRAIGCDTAQGYHFARPMPADALTDRLERSRETVRLR